MTGSADARQATFYQVPVSQRKEEAPAPAPAAPEPEPKRAAPVDDGKLSEYQEAVARANARIDGTAPGYEPPALFGDGPPEPGRAAEAVAQFANERDRYNGRIIAAARDRALSSNSLRDEEIRRMGAVIPKAPMPMGVDDIVTAMQRVQEAINFGQNKA